MTNTKTNAVKAKRTTSTKKTVDYEKAMAEMKNGYEKQLEDMKKMIESLQANMMPSAPIMVNNIDKEVTFVSLCNHILNLSTEPNGGGDVYTFTSFGEEQNIPYSDARKIIKNNKSFIKGGKCIIADDEIIAAEHLTNDYKKLLDKDELINLLTEDRKRFKEVFASMTQTQKEVFKDIVVKRLYEDKDSIDMNIVQVLNDEFDTDILKSINYEKELMNTED